MSHRLDILNTESRPLGDPKLHRTPFPCVSKIQGVIGLLKISPKSKAGGNEATWNSDRNDKVYCGVCLFKVTVTHLGSRGGVGDRNI